METEWMESNVRGEDLQLKVVDHLAIIEGQITLQSNKIEITSKDLANLIHTREKLIETANALRRLLGKPTNTTNEFTSSKETIKKEPPAVYYTWA
jgi:hypothetical protein